MNKLSIKTRSLLLALLPAVFMFLSLTIYFISDKFNVLEQQLDHKGELLAQQLAPASEYAVFIKNPGLLEEVVSPILNESDVVYVEIYDADDQLLLSRKNLSLIDTANKDNLKVYQSKVMQQDIPLGGNTLDLSMDSELEDNQSKSIGRISLALTKQNIIDQQQQTLLNGILIALGCILLTLILSMYVSTSITRPIRSLSETIKLYKSGIFSARVEQLSGGELGAVEFNLNTMASTLESAKRKELEHAMALEQSRREADDANKAKSEFLTNMSFEFREPINAILGRLHLLENNNIDSESRQFIEQSILSANMLIELSDNVLDYSKLETDSLILNLDYFDPVRLIKRSFSPFLREFCIKNIDTHVSHKLHKSILIQADQRQLQKVIYHLIQNAIQHTENGSIDLKLNGYPTTDNSKYILNIELIDTGIGFDPNQLARLYQSFSQSHHLDKPFQSNSGLGLAIAKKLTEIMGGTLNINSAPDKGNEYKLEFVFPYKPIIEEPVETNADTDNQTPVTGRVLVIESSSIDQMVAKDILNKMGTTVDLAINGKVALEKLRQVDYQLIVSDTNITDIAILDLVQRIKAFERAANKHLPILLLTADVIGEHWQELLEAGVNDLLLKPVDYEALREKVTELLA
ncbi:ATP-binding protein [Pleionea mediterranea]|uniref:histidine kinase n=1 Tax=Pleionea mediterranea TaxID=523701 RepID=A0A316G6K2_9GAMM|nr:ATP-binding protein [Pleionea mediterranea]PWK50077.1 signal transduction histidine kinase [Pleionea mediterranea]